MTTRRPDNPMTSIRVFYGQMPVKLRFSYGTMDTHPFSIVELSAGELRGYGETLVHPTPGLLDAARGLIGRDPLLLDGLIPLPSGDEDRMALESLSIALFDLVGKVKGVPVHALLGGKKADHVPLMPCIFPTTAQDAAEKASSFVKKGFRGLKTKLVGALDEDTQIVTAIRAVVGNEIVLQGDANRGYKSLKEAIAAVRRLGDMGLDIFEDPLLGSIDEYKQLRGLSRAKIMIDHYNRQFEEYAEALAKQACDMVNLHPVQPGGLGRALTKVRMARDAGVQITVGGTGFTGFGTAAYHQLSAVACPGCLCGELGGYIDHGMPVALVTNPLPIADGSVAVNESPGLGQALNQEALLPLQPEEICIQ